MSEFTQEEKLVALTHAYEHMDYFISNDEQYRKNVRVIETMLIDLSPENRKDEANG